MGSDVAAVRIVEIEAGQAELADGLVHRKCIPFAILAQPTRGSYVVTGADGAIRVPAGGVALVAAGVPVVFAHHAAAGDAMAARWLHLRAVLHDTVDPCALVRTPHLLGAHAARRVSSLLREAMAARGASLAARLDRLGIACRALGIALADAPPHPQAARRLNAGVALGRLSALVQAQLGEPLSVATLARRLGVSRSQLHALCQAHLGMGPMAYVKELRLAEAARALLLTQDGLAATAERVGFANPFHLSREFARRYGMPPRRWRAESRLGMGVVLPASADRGAFDGRDSVSAPARER